MSLPATTVPGVPTVPTERGTLPGEFPSVRVGDGPRTLVVIPGFGDAMFSGRYPPTTEPVLVTYFGRYLDGHSVTLVSRPRGLSENYSIEKSADDHARTLQALGPVDVLGISMGGLIGQQLSVRHPGLVDRLVVVDSACRLADEGRAPVQEMLEYATEHDWFSLRAALARGLYSDWRRVTYPPLIQTMGRFVLPRPADPADVSRSLEAILDYDGCDQLDDIDHPSLVVGGDRDPYFTAAVMRETAEGIPNAELSLIRGGKHGAFHEHKSTFDRRVTDFLAE